jgi:hypothetical protein
MVDGSCDADAVTAKILRETRDAKVLRSLREEEAAASAATVLEDVPLAAYGAAGAAETVAATVPPAPPPDADAAFRKARLGFSAALALALLLAWIAQRRASAREAR